MMAAVQAGGDRQEVHEVVRRNSHAVTERIKAGTASSAELLTQLRADPVFAQVDVARFAAQTAREFVGRAPEQVSEFLTEYVDPIRRRYASVRGMTAELEV
jgi:adenylosuccinate lyase